VELLDPEGGFKVCPSFWLLFVPPAPGLAPEPLHAETPSKSPTKDRQRIFLWVYIMVLSSLKKKQLLEKKTLVAAQQLSVVSLNYVY
jgi:hypothetical protein